MNYLCRGSMFFFCLIFLNISAGVIPAPNTDPYYNFLGSTKDTLKSLLDPVPDLLEKQVKPQLVTIYDLLNSKNNPIIKQSIDTFFDSVKKAETTFADVQKGADGIANSVNNINPAIPGFQTLKDKASGLKRHSDNCANIIKDLGSNGVDILSILNNLADKMLADLAPIIAKFPIPRPESPKCLVDRIINFNTDICGWLDAGRASISAFQAYIAFLSGETESKYYQQLNENFANFTKLQEYVNTVGALSGSPALTNVSWSALPPTHPADVPAYSSSTSASSSGAGSTDTGSPNFNPAPVSPQRGALELCPTQDPFKTMCMTIDTVRVPAIATIRDSLVQAKGLVATITQQLIDIKKLLLTVKSMHDDAKSKLAYISNLMRITIPDNIHYYWNFGYSKMRNDYDTCVAQKSKLQQDLKKIINIGMNKIRDLQTAVDDLKKKAAAKGNELLAKKAKLDKMPVFANPIERAKLIALVKTLNDEYIVLLRQQKKLQDDLDEAMKRTPSQAEMLQIAGAPGIIQQLLCLNAQIIILKKGIDMFNGMGRELLAQGINVQPLPMAAYNAFVGVSIIPLLNELVGPTGTAEKPMLDLTEKIITDGLVSLTSLVNEFIDEDRLLGLLIVEIDAFDASFLELRKAICDVGNAVAA